MLTQRTPQFRALFQMIVSTDARVADMVDLFTQYIDRANDRIVAGAIEGTQWQIVILFKDADTSRAVSMMENVIGRVSVEPDLKDAPVYPCLVAKIPMLATLRTEDILAIARTARQYPHTRLTI